MDKEAKGPAEKCVQVWGLCNGQEVEWTFQRKKYFPVQFKLQIEVPWLQGVCIDSLKRLTAFYKLTCVFSTLKYSYISSPEPLVQI